MVNIKHKITIETYGTMEDAANIHLAIMDIVKESVSVTVKCIDENDKISAKQADIH